MCIITYQKIHPCSSQNNSSILCSKHTTVRSRSIPSWNYFRSWENAAPHPTHSAPLHVLQRPFGSNVSTSPDKCCTIQTKNVFLSSKCQSPFQNKKRKESGLEVLRALLKTQRKHWFQDIGHAFDLQVHRHIAVPPVVVFTWMRLSIIVWNEWRFLHDGKGQKPNIGTMNCSLAGDQNWSYLHKSSHVMQSHICHI